MERSASYLRMAGRAILLAFTAVQVAAVTYRYGDESATFNKIVTENVSQISGVSNRKDKDFVLGALIPIHGAIIGGGKCGGIQVDGGVEEMEAMLFTLDLINSNSTLLPNLTLGYDIRDTCYSENIGLDETLDLIIIGTERELASCDYGGMNQSTVFRNTSTPTTGIIGATASGVSIHVAGLSRLFEVPQVSYASTSPLLSNRDQFSFFYRTIPPDDLQAKAMVAFLIRNSWSHISIVFSGNPYGIAGRDEIVVLAEAYGICIDLNERMEDDTDFTSLAVKIDESDANIIVAFAIKQDMNKLLNKSVLFPSFSNLTWIASDAWAGATSILTYFEGKVTGGLFGIAPTAQHYELYDSYFSQLTIATNRRNPWFEEYFRAKTGCEGSVSCNESVVHESQRSQIPLIINAVYSLAYALDNFLNANCDKPLVWYIENRTCSGQKRLLNGTLLKSYLANVSFMSPTGSEIAFDHHGNLVKASYEIINYQVTTGGNKVIASIGTWKTNGSTLEDNSLGVLQLYESAMLQFGSDSNGQAILSPSVSECGRCTPGYYHEPVISSCCGVCMPCLGETYSDQNQAPSCKNCSDLGELWGNDPLQGSDSCVFIPETFLSFDNPYSIVIAIIASLGLLMVLFVAIVFGLHWNTPVVKSSSREQMTLLLIGVSASLVLAYLFVTKPVLGICIMQRVGLWFCHSLMFGALMVKSIRIARIFLNKSSMKPLRFADTQYQILFTLIVVFGQMILVASSVAYDRPSIVREIRLNSRNNNDFPEVVVTCNRDPLVFILLSVVYESALIAVMTILGIVSFKFPANFNEAKHVTFCTFAIIVIWMGFIPSYFATNQVAEYQKAVLSAATAASAITVLVCIFGPRLYIILFHKKNNSIEFSRSKQEVCITSQGDYLDSTTFSTLSVRNGQAIEGGHDHPTDSEVRAATSDVDATNTGEKCHADSNE